MFVDKSSQSQKREKFYITTAIDYVNAAPHIGHAYEKVAADVLARHNRIRGREVFFLTGVDEHGSKVQKSAEAAGKTPQLFCDEMALKFQNAWKALDISYDYFIRTSEERHSRVTQMIFARARDKGDIYKAKYLGLYCEGCEDFKRERDLDDKGLCPNHKVPPKSIEEENYFFALTKYKPILKEWLVNNPQAVQPESRRNEVLKQLDDPDLGDFSVSRSRSSLTWGIPVPDEPDQVIYVWVDALINYITGIGFEEYALKPSEAGQFAKFWPANLHLIGKDIVKFHSIYWPAILMAADLPVPQMIYGHGFLTVEGQKISKSLGNVIDPVALCEKYGADAVRFFLFAGTPFDQDGDFSREQLVKKVNAELANNLGNLLNRTLNLVVKNCDGKVPDAEADHNLREIANSIHPVVDEHMKKLEFAKAIEAIFALVDQANKYIADERPWTLFKEGKQKEGEKVLFTALEVLRRSALSIYPFTPSLATAIWHQLGYAEVISLVGEAGEQKHFETIPVGQSVRNEGPVFKRIEEPVVA
jgi:methionyl-tRNA synthetase